MTVQPVDRIIVRFLRSKRDDWSDENRDNATAVLNRAHRWLAERHVTLLHDDPDDLYDYLDEYLEHRGSTPSERTGRLRAKSSLLVEHRQLCVFYKWACMDLGGGDRLLQRNPMFRIPAPKPDPIERDRLPVAQAWQYEALLATCRRRKPVSDLDLRDAAILAVLWHTGMRRSELCNIDFERIDFTSEQVYLPRTKGGRRSPQSRWVLLPEECMALVDRYIDRRGRHEGPLFVSQRGGRLHPDSINAMQERRGDLAAEALGLDECVYMPAHGYRRSSAIDWLEHGGAESTLMTNHGWRTRKQIDDYTGAKREQLAVADARKVAAARRKTNLRAV